jgi:RND family efflux transporter MFP subunit
MKTHWNSPLLAALLACALAISGCGNNSTGARDEHDKAAASQSAGTHGGEGEKYTHYTTDTELFLETPALVAGQPARFAAHFTRLADFKPVTSGALQVALSGGGLPEERFSADAPALPGIYKPVLTPIQAGNRELTLILDTAHGVVRHELGPLRVFATAAEAQQNHDGHDDHDEGIGFTKEQQWKVDFATAVAVKGRARSTVAGNGVLRAHPDGEALLSAPAAGQMHAAGAFPHVGMTVKRGRILAYLAPRLGGETDYAALEAGAAKARVAHAQAQRERQRMETLFEADAVPEKRVQAALAEEQMAAAELAATTRRLGQYGGEGRVAGGGIAIRAPLDGVVADVKAAAGGYVQEGALLFHIADTRRLWLEVRIPESEAVRLGQASGVWFSLDGEDTVREFEAGKNAKLIAIGDVIDPATRTVAVVFEFANADRHLRLGQSVNAQVRGAVAGRDALLVPVSALQDENGTATVYVQRGGESFERRIVSPGQRDGPWIEIRDGLAEGERVVAKGAYLVRLASTKTEASGHAH